MMDMVRKHCVEGSGNHRMIMGILEHTKVMLQDTKHVSRVFVRLTRSTACCSSQLIESRYPQKTHANKFP